MPRSLAARAPAGPWRALAAAGLAGLAAACATPPGETAVAPDLPLLTREQVSYVGAFRVPVIGSRPDEGLRYGGVGLTYDAQAGTLFMIGHPWLQQSVELGIPAPGTAPDPSGLPRAALIQPPTDPLGGRRGDISDPPSPDDAQIGGQLRAGDRLIVSAHHYYDAEGRQVRSHFSRPRTLAAADGLVGPVRLTRAVPARWLGGPMAHVPLQWQAALGGAALTGMANLPIAGHTSHGPTAAVFDPATLDAARLLVGYPLSAPLASLDRRNPLWNFTSEVGGMVLVENTRSLLFFGRHGTGPYCYGSGDTCADPAKDDQGTHGYPYRYQVWAYDVAHLAAVARGERRPAELEPYAVWPLTLPFARDDEHHIGGVAYDPQGQRLFLSQREGDADNEHPLIHVLRIGPPGDDGPQDATKPR